MVNIYDDIKNEIVEQLANDLFYDFGVNTEKINPGHMIDVMLMLKGKIKVDVEKSEFLSDHGELTVDFVSACEPVSADTSKDAHNLFDQFAQKQNIHITKKGKHFEKDNFDYLMVLLYDDFINASEYSRYEKPSTQAELVPDHTLLIKSNELTDHILKNSDYYFERIKITKKTGNPLINKVDSSAIKVPIEKLRNETNCLFYDKLDVDKEEVLNYLGL